MDATRLPKLTDSDNVESPQVSCNMTRHHEMILMHVIVQSECWFFEHKPGGGQPNRTTSGRVKAAYVFDPSIHFHDSKASTEIYNMIRHKGDDRIRYKKELDQMLEDKQKFKSKEAEDSDGTQHSMEEFFFGKRSHHRECC